MSEPSAFWNIDIGLELQEDNLEELSADEASELLESIVDKISSMLIEDPMVYNVEISFSESD